MAVAKQVLDKQANSNIIDMNDISTEDAQAEIPTAIISADLKTLGKVMSINTNLA